MKLVSLIRNISIYGFAVLFFLAPKVLPVLLILAMVSSVFTDDFKLIKKELKKGILFFLVSFFLIFAISFFYSNNTDAAIKGIELKISFLLFPIFFPVLLKSKKVNFRRILDFLFLSVFVSFLISFFRAIYRYIYIKDLNVFFNMELSFIIHPSYLAVSLNLILLIVLYRIVIDKKSIKSLIGVTLLLCVYIVLAASKIGLILLVFNFIVFIVFYAIKQNKVKLALISFLSLTLIVLLTVKYVPTINDKFNKLHEELFYKDYNDVNIDLASTGQRIVAWKTSLNIIKENVFLGVGVGDIRDVLNEKYNQAGYKHMKQGLDSHQQFMQTWAAVGVFGFVVLLLIFSWLIIVSIKRRDILLLLFASNIFLFCLTESMLETQAGVFCFLFFLYIFESEKLRMLLKIKN